jgi:hypothetical protein
VRRIKEKKRGNEPFSVKEEKKEREKRGGEFFFF